MSVSCLVLSSFIALRNLSISWDASSCVGASRVDGVFLDINVAPVSRRSSERKKKDSAVCSRNLVRRVAPTL